MLCIITIKFNDQKMAALSPRLLTSPFMATPLIQLEDNLWAKMEMANVTGSVKDRPAASMFYDAFDKGLIAPGGKLLEASSGNTGIALASIAARHDMTLTVVIPENVTAERIELLRLFGVDIIFSPAEGGSNGAVAMADQIAQEDDSFVQLDQYRNPANPLAHELGTGPEIIEQLGGAPDVFVAGLGTGGTLMGCSRAFKNIGAETKVVAVEPFPGEGLDGLRSLDEGFVPPLLDLSLIDKKFIIRQEDALEGVHWLLHKGVFAGFSSGAIAQIARRQEAEKIVMIVCDDGWRYRESGLYSDSPKSNISFW